MRSIMMFMW